MCIFSNVFQLQATFEYHALQMAKADLVVDYTEPNEHHTIQSIKWLTIPSLAAHREKKYELWGWRVDNCWRLQMAVACTSGVIHTDGDSHRASISAFTCVIHTESRRCGS